MMASRRSSTRSRCSSAVGGTCLLERVGSGFMGESSVCVWMAGLARRTHGVDRSDHRGRRAGHVVEVGISSAWECSVAIPTYEKERREKEGRRKGERREKEGRRVRGKSKR